MLHTIEFLKMLADKRRLRIVTLLVSAGELAVSEFVEALQVSQPSVSHALADLRDAGIVVNRREGVRVYYALAPNRRAYIEQIVDALSRQFPREGMQYRNEAAGSAYGSM